MKIRIMLFSLIITLMMVSLPINAIAKSKIIPNDNSGIPDKVLYQTILRKLGKNKSFTESDVVKIKRLNVSNYDKKKVETLEGIGKLKNLVILDVSHNNLKSLSGIENLSKLKILYANNNKLKNIDSVKNLFELNHIQLDHNRLTDMEGLTGLTKLQSVHAQVNKLKKLPDLTKQGNLTQVNFKYNRLSKRELDRKIPISLGRKDVWFKSQVNLQNLVRSIKLVKPNSFGKINKNTKKISGKANKKAMIVLRDPTGKRIKAVRADIKGTFSLKNLDLNMWAGKKLSLESYVVDQLYYERETLKVVKFTIPN